MAGSHSPIASQWRHHLRQHHNYPPPPPPNRINKPTRHPWNSLAFSGKNPALPSNILSNSANSSPPNSSSPCALPTFPTSSTFPATPAFHITLTYRLGPCTSATEDEIVRSGAKSQVCRTEGAELAEAVGVGDAG